MGVEVVTAPTGSVVDTGSAKDHLRIPPSIDQFDNDVEAKLAAVTAYAEQICGRAFLTQTWRLSLDGFPPIIRLPGGPVTEIVSVSYTDANGNAQTLDPSLYQADLVSDIPRLAPMVNTCWPRVQGGLNQVRVEYVVGYGDADAVPTPIVQAIKLLLGDAWINREAALTSRFYVPNVATDNLLWPYRIVMP